MKRVLFVVGSLRKGSFNRQLAERASEMIKGKAEIAFLDYEDLPFMNQDIEFPVPEAVERVREEVRKSHALWFFTPEYNYSYPGVLKNLLDWLSRAQREGGSRDEAAICGKLVTASSAAGKSKGAGARRNLSELFSAINAKALDTEECGVSLIGESFAKGKLVLSEEDEERLKRQVEDLIRALD